jgi:hypothetical protein
MHKSLRRLFPAVLGALALGLAGGSLAWACIPGVNLDLSPSSGPAGAEVRAHVYGSTAPEEAALYPEGRTVEIWWNSKNGPRMHEPIPVTKSEFWVTVRIPKGAAPGANVVLAVVREADGEVLDESREDFQVTLPDSGTVPKTPGTSPKGTGRKSGRPSGRRSGNGASDRITGPTGGHRTAAGRRAGATAHPSGRPQPGVATRSGRDVFADSLAPSGPGASAGPHVAPAGAGQERTAAGVPERSAIGDLWSGFGSGRLPSLISSEADPLVTEDGPGGQLAVGVGLLGTGLLALIGGGAVAQLRRRRAPAPTLKRH